MEKYKELLLKAKNSLRTADHLTYITYPLIKDAKIIVSITENIYSSVIDCMNSLIEYDILYKRIGLQGSDFDTRFDIFKENVKNRHKIDRETIELIKELRTIIKSSKGNHAKFMREDKFYLYTSDFKTRSLTLEEIKDFLIKTKRFINKLDMIYKI